MKVLIAKANQDIFKDFDKKLKFEESTKNTCTFNCSTAKFEKIRIYVREQGYNPFSLMAW